MYEDVEVSHQHTSNLQTDIKTQHDIICPTEVGHKKTNDTNKKGRSNIETPHFNRGGKNSMHARNFIKVN